MARGMLNRMSGEELLVLRVLGEANIGAMIDAELDRRARSAPARSRRADQFWAGRNHAQRRSARLAA